MAVCTPAVKGSTPGCNCTADCFSVLWSHHLWSLISAHLTLMCTVCAKNHCTLKIPCPHFGTGRSKQFVAQKRTSNAYKLEWWVHVANNKQNDDCGYSLYRMNNKLSWNVYGPQATLCDTGFAADSQTHCTMIISKGILLGLLVT